MTPEQEAKLLRARALSLRAEVHLFSTIIAAELGEELLCTRMAEADANEAVASELDQEAALLRGGSQSTREPRDAEDSCVEFDVSEAAALYKGCVGDGHFRCKDCVHFEAPTSLCCGRSLQPGETCGDCTNQKEE